jgi:PAS domain S-box-containing protein
VLVDDTSPHAAVHATGSEMEKALRACDFPIIVWDLPSATMRLANDQAAEMLGLPLRQVLGRRATDFFSPKAAVEQSFATQSSGAVDFVEAKRDVRLPGGELVPVRLWAKVVDLDGDKQAVTVFVPVTQAGRLGRDPSRPWRDVAPVAVGFVDSKWRITGLSADIAILVGRESQRMVGSSLLDLIHPDDLSWARAVAERRVRPHPHSLVRLSHTDGGWVRACLLAAPARRRSDGIAFALVGTPPPQKVLGADQVEKLVLHLRRIGAEVRAAGVLDDVVTLPTSADHPELGELSSRQWEILSRLLKGERVPTIAKQLFLSPSTVRNHLTATFRRFGVHSQADLIEVLTTARQKN